MTEPGGPDRIDISSGYGGRTRAPYVQIVWGERVAQLTPDEARAHALRIVECAAAAEHDAFVFEWVGANLPPRVPDDERLDTAARIMADFREWRRRRGEPS